jgi:hypothetical protein
MYLHCSISILIRVIRPTSFSAAADSTPQCIFIALFQFYSGYSPDELLRRGGLHPAMYLHCSISILLNSLIEDYKGNRFFLIYQINRVKAAAFD